ncbi:MAG: type II secretion system major pseudopilin GspG [Synergistaceae bacterium]|jgi:general secretion pathway protein G|nr:type II secretion system major pseudopilin GspG [Synergistaceae bacterium]
MTGKKRDLRACEASAPRKRRGFTLIEIMVVVVILGLLAAIVVPNVVARVAEARRTAAKTQIESFASALEMYRLYTGSYPTTQQGLDALFHKPTIAPVPKKYPPEPYMKGNLPDDPWGNPYIYRCPGERGAYDIVSTGPDGEEGGEGANADIANHDPT